MFRTYITIHICSEGALFTLTEVTNSQNLEGSNELYCTCITKNKHINGQKK